MVVEGFVEGSAAEGPGANVLLKVSSAYARQECS